MLFTVHIYFFVVSCAFVLGAPGDRLTVNLTDGRISGIESMTADNNNTFWAFFGIPYAAPPVGDRRFKPPQPVAHWSDTRDASYERSICTQSQNPVIGSEDCLYINVYTTHKITGDVDQPILPVMVWIHGGGFIMGSGNLDLHGADRFLDNGVLIVSLNYRLGVFGFLSTQDAASPGNYGLKDQIAALKWVKNNVAKFGGNPNSVTIFGESAGAASVHYLLQSKLSQGLYHAAISESGSTLDTWTVAQNPRNLAFQIGVTNFIFTLNSSDLVNRLRQVNYKNIQNTATGITVDLRDNWNGLPWAPCIENNVEGAVVTSYSYVQQKYGDFNRVPLLTGFNSLEAREFGNLKWLINLYTIEFSLFKEKLVPKDMHAVSSDEAGTEIKQFYFGNGPVSNNSNFDQYATDTLFVRGIHKTVQLQSKYVPVYFYRFSFTGGVMHKNFTPEGVSHAEELQFLFSAPSTVQVTPEAKLTQRRMLALWTNFAKYQNPTPNHNDPALGNVTWPTAASAGGDNTAYLDIGSQLVVATNPENEAMVFWDNLYNQYGFQPYNSY